MLGLSGRGDNSNQRLEWSELVRGGNLLRVQSAAAHWSPRDGSSCQQQTAAASNPNSSHSGRLSHTTTHTHLIITSACWHGNRNHLAGSLTYDVIRRAECDWTGDEWLLSWEGWWAGVYLKYRDRAMVSRQAETNPRWSDVSALSVAVQHITGRPLHTQANESWGAQILNVSY